MGSSSEDEDIPRARKKVRRRENTAARLASREKVGDSQSGQRGGGGRGGAEGESKEYKNQTQAPPRPTAPIQNVTTNTLQRRPGVRAPPPLPVPLAPSPLPSPPSSPSAHANTESNPTTTKQSVSNSLAKSRSSRPAAPPPPHPPRPVTPPLPLARPAPGAPPGTISSFLSSSPPPNLSSSSARKRRQPKPKPRSYATKPRPVPVRPARGPSFSDAEEQGQEQREGAAIAHLPPPPITRNGAEQREAILNEGAEKKVRKDVLGANRRGKKREERMNLEDDGRGGENECPRLRLDDGRRSPQLHFATSRPSKRPRVHTAPSFPTARSILKPSTSKRANDIVSSSPEMQTLSTLTALAMALHLPEGFTIDLLDGRRGIKRKRGGASTLPNTKMSAKLVVVGALKGQGGEAQKKKKKKKKKGGRGVPQLEMMEVEDGPLTPPPEREDRSEDRLKKKTKEKERSRDRPNPLPALAAPPPRNNALRQTVPLPPRPKAYPTPPIASDSISPVDNAQVLPPPRRRQPSDSIESFPSLPSNPTKQQKAKEPVVGKRKELPLEVISSSSETNASRAWEGKQKKRASSLHAIEGGEWMDEEEMGEDGARGDAFVEGLGFDRDQNQDEDEYGAYLDDDSFFAGVDMDFDGDLQHQQQQPPVVNRGDAHQRNGLQDVSSPLDGPFSSPSNGPLKKTRNVAVPERPRSRPESEKVLFPLDQVLDKISSSLAKNAAVEEEIEESSREGSREELVAAPGWSSARAGKQREKEIERQQEKQETVVPSVTQHPPSDRRSSLRSSTSAASASTSKIVSTREKRNSKDVVARSSRRIVDRETPDTHVPATLTPPHSPNPRVPSPPPPRRALQPTDPSNHPKPPAIDASVAKSGPSKPARLPTSSVVASNKAPSPPPQPEVPKRFVDRTLSITNRTFSISSIQTQQHRGSSVPLPPGMSKDDFEFVTGAVGSTRRRRESGQVLKSSLRKGHVVSTGPRRRQRTVSFAAAPLPSPPPLQHNLAPPQSAPAPPFLRQAPSSAPVPLFPPSPPGPPPRQENHQRTPVKRFASLPQLALPSSIPATATPPSVAKRSPSSSSLTRKGSRRLSEILVPASSLSPYFVGPKPKQQRVHAVAGRSKPKPKPTSASSSSSPATNRLPPPPPLRSKSSSASRSNPVALLPFPRTKASTQPSKPRPTGLRSSSPALPSSPLGGGRSSTSRTSPRFVAFPTTTRNSPRNVLASSSSKDQVASGSNLSGSGGRASQRVVDDDGGVDRVGGWRGVSFKTSGSTVAAGVSGNGEKTEEEMEEEQWKPSQDDFFRDVVEPSSRVRGRAAAAVGGGERGGGEDSTHSGAGAGGSSKRPLGRSKRIG